MKSNEKLIDEFKMLSSFDSESFEELDISLYLIKRLKELGLAVSIDDAGKKLNNNPKATGNIYGFLKGNVKGESILLSAHMDTVKPGKSKKVVVDGDVIKSDGTTVLGSDDITGIITILEALEEIKEKNLEHPNIEVVFFIAEELYGKGSSVFDYSKIKSKYAYVFDLSGEIGLAAYAAPSIISFNIEVFGKSAHTGFDIEEGISAIKIASDAISKINVGRIDDNTTLNIGTINGGVGINIVPDNVIVKGEIRSYDKDFAIDLVDYIKNIFVTSAKALNSKINFDYTENIRAYNVSLDSYVVSRYKNALEELNIEPKLIKTFGGSDNNNLNKYGIEGIVVANAMNNVHTVKEYFDINDLIKSINIAIKLITIK